MRLAMPSGQIGSRPRRRTRLGIAAAAVLAGAALAACGSDEPSDEEVRADALASLELTTEATALEADMADLADRLAQDPDGEDGDEVLREIEALDARASELIDSAGAEASFDVELAELNGSGVAGSARVARSGETIAVEGSIDGAVAGEEHPVAIHGLEHGEGAAVCPPRDAAEEEELAAGEAEDFYGEEIVDLTPIAGEAGAAELSTSRESPDAPPLGARVLVVHGAESGDEFDRDLPAACGELIAAAGDEPTGAVVAAAAGQRAALADLTTVLDDPASARAEDARTRAVDRIEAANAHLRRAAELIRSVLEELDELPDEELRLVEQAMANLEQSAGRAGEAYEELRVALRRERSARRARERRRREAQREREERERQEQAPAPAPTPAPAPPQPSPPPANGRGGPEPTPPPPADEGGFGGPDCSLPENADICP